MENMLYRKQISCIKNKDGSLAPLLPGKKILLVTVTGIKFKDENIPADLTLIWDGKEQYKLQFHFPSKTIVLITPVNENNQNGIEVLSNIIHLI